MPDTHLPLYCPHCDYNSATLVVRSFSVITVMCEKCGYTWAADVSNLSTELRQELPVHPRER